MKIIQFPLDKNSREDDLQLVKKTFQNGGIVIFPTETCYGVAVDARNESAVSKLLDYKDRPAGKAISIAVGNKALMKKYIKYTPHVERLSDTFLPGPITLISKITEFGRNDIDGRLINQDTQGLGIRIPAYPSLIDLLNEIDIPITATSANIAGQNPPYSIDALLNQLSAKKKSKIDLVLDAGKIPPNTPSTVIDTTKDIKIIREGTLTDRDIKKSLSYISNSEQITVEIAKKITQSILSEKKTVQNSNINNNSVQNITRKLVLMRLNGDLGAGKTRFTHGVGSVLGIKETEISSPTFNYVDEHISDDAALFHIDLWKLAADSPNRKVSLEDLGIEINHARYKKKKRIVIVCEWPQNLEINSDGTNGNEAIKQYKIIVQRIGENQRNILFRQMEVDEER